MASAVKLADPDQAGIMYFAIDTARSIIIVFPVPVGPSSTKL